jgi:Fe-S-cluster containining protein
MALGVLGALLGPKTKLPRDHVTRPRRSAKKAATEHAAGMQEALDRLSAMPGIADIAGTKRVPRGFYDAVDDFRRHYDAYAAVVGKFLPIPEDAKQPGEPGGCQGCIEAPMPVHGFETLSIYREIRTWKDFGVVARRLGELGEEQFKAIQAGHTGKDPEKIRFGSKAVQEGRVAFAKTKAICPLLDQDKERCRVWERRPIACRMHWPTSPPATQDPDHPDYPKSAKAVNIRLPVKQQVAVHQLDKRLSLQLSPFLYASLLQVLQLADGQLIQEVGEAPVRMQQDGKIAERANRNVKHAAKNKKKKSSAKGKKRK